ncbi:MAG: aminotransferase class I/II-fold pyridoxal phosphate-dependent enzyme [Erysipelotrichaceae bacterium]
MNKLDDYRKKIDVVDKKIMSLLEERLTIVDDVLNYKKNNDIAIYDNNREDRILANVIENSELSNQEDLLDMYRYLMETSKRRQARALNPTNFINRKFDGVLNPDAVFATLKRAKDDQFPDKVVNATVGSLIGEDGKLVAFKSVYDIYSNLDYKDYASYASGMQGNPDFLAAVAKWILPQGYAGYHRVFATPGGSGSLSLTLDSVTNIGETIIIPDLAWGNYNVMAKLRNLKIANFAMFDDNDSFNVAGLKETIKEVGKYQKRIVIIINDPVHNPSGYSMSQAMWQEIIDFVGTLANDVVILNDIAYLDYCADKKSGRAYLHKFAELADNTTVVLAASCSKALSMYGVRLGAAIVLGSKLASDTMYNTFLTISRGIWSSVNNGAMVAFSKIMSENQSEWLLEQESYVSLLKERAEIILKEAKEVNLSLYPYHEGFFITMKLEQKYVTLVQEALMREHIYVVAIKGGLRIAVCCLPKAKCYGLANSLKKAYENIKNK